MNREPLTPKNTSVSLEKTHLKILVIDDEPAALSSAKAVLSGGNYQVLLCRSAIEALEILENENIDCVITDLLMPVMDGFELVRNIRSSPKHSSVPILVLTRKRLREDVQAAVQAGANDYILKPIDEQVFLDKLEASIKKEAGVRHVFEHTLHGNGIPGEIKIGIRIIALSETDMTLGLPMADIARAAQGQEIESRSFEMTSRLFDDIGITPPFLHLLYCKKVEKSVAIAPEYPYEARYSFMGLQENDSRKIRAWLHRQALQRRK